MINLSASDIECLRRIKDEPGTDDPPCPDKVLTRLMNLGLVECRPNLWAPLETIEMKYHLTSSGEAYLDERD